MKAIGPAAATVSQGVFAYNALRTKILHLQLEPGTKISEKEISSQLGVSRTPVREAFVRLSQEGLVDIYPQRGTFVSQINLDHIDEARFVRERLESAVLRLAVDNVSDHIVGQLRRNLAEQEFCREERNQMEMFRLDNLFHRLIYASCGKERTWDFMVGFGIDFHRWRILRLSHAMPWDSIVTQHNEMFDHIVAGDLDSALTVSVEHLTLVDVDREPLIKEYPRFFISSRNKW